MTKRKRTTTAPPTDHDEQEPMFDSLDAFCEAYNIDIDAATRAKIEREMEATDPDARPAVADDCRTLH